MKRIDKLFRIAEGDIMNAIKTCSVADFDNVNAVFNKQSVNRAEWLDNILNMLAVHTRRQAELISEEIDTILIPARKIDKSLLSKEEAKFIDYILMASMMVLTA